MFLGPVQEEVITDNTFRKKYNHGELFEFGRILEKIEKKNAEEEKRKAGEKYGKGHPKVVVKLPHPMEEEIGKRRDKVATNLSLKSGKSWATKDIE